MFLLQRKYQARRGIEAIQDTTADTEQSAKSMVDNWIDDLRTVWITITRQSDTVDPKTKRTPDGVSYTEPELF